MELHQQISDRDLKIQTMERQATQAELDYEQKLSKLEHSFEAASLRAQSSYAQEHCPDYSDLQQ